MILQSQSEVAGAEMSALIATYEHLTGRAVKRFASRAVAERRVTDAFMSSADADGHLGVPKGRKGEPKAHADLVEKAKATGREDPKALATEGLPGSAEGVEADAERNPYPAGTLASRLWTAAKTGAPVAPPMAPISAPAAPIAAKARAVVAKATASGEAYRVTAPGTETATVRATSVRGQVLAAIRSAGLGGISFAGLVETFGDATRGCIGKLLATKHIEEVPK